MENKINIKELNEIELINEIQKTNKIANIVKNIFDKNCVIIDNKKYIKAVGWQSVARLFNCSTIIKNIEKTDTGYLSYAEIYLNENIISSSYGFCGFDEIKNGIRERKEFELISMSQTRAISRAIRNAFSFLLGFLNEYDYTILEDLPEDLQNKKIFIYENKTDKKIEINNLNNEKSLQNKEIINNISEPKNLNNDLNQNNDINNLFKNTSDFINYIKNLKDKNEAYLIAKNISKLNVFKNGSDKQKEYIVDILNKKLNNK